ncbi:Putative exported protein precursor [Burkholderia pseudomallei]|nr:Putative exported protein precursor [Burkholderia pseudomallei]
MKIKLVATLVVAMLSIAAHAETRCGIITNTLPGGALTLDDRDASWQLDAEGVPDKMPPTNRGEQCGCVTGTTNPATHAFTSVTGGKLKPMKACDVDKKLMQAFNARNR